MSTYIEAMASEERFVFKQMKKEFKRGKECAVCGNKYKPNKMTVDHIKRVSDGADIYDFTNWQVLCTDCHYKKSRQEMGQEEL